jgi:alkylation response protein AidB-like acyl-CoA dehydrogenase
MMSFGFSPEQEMARTALRELLADVANPKYVRECDLGHRPPREAFDALARGGWLGLGIDERYGGSGGGSVDVAILLEEAGRAHLDLGFWLFRNLSYGGSGIGQHGTEQQRATYLPRIARGELTMAFSLTEPDAGSDAAAIITRAETDGDDFLITGQKWFTSGFTVADLCLVVARTDHSGRKHEGITNFLVDTKSPGITVTPIPALGMWSLGTYGVYYDHVRVPRANVLGTIGQGWVELRDYLEMERLCLCAARLGAATAVLEEAIAYAKERHQFGRAIGSFQGVSHKIADMATWIDAARVLVYRFAWMKDQGLPRGKEAAMLKLYVSEIYQRVAEMGLQVMGGHGYTMESAMSRHYRDSKIGTIGAGSSEIQRNIIARELGLPAK